MTTITEKLEELHKEIEQDGINLTKMEIYDDEDLILYALNFLLANLDHLIFMEEDYE